MQDLYPTISYQVSAAERRMLRALCVDESPMGLSRANWAHRKNCTASKTPRPDGATERYQADKFSSQAIASFMSYKTPEALFHSRVNTEVNTEREETRHFGSEATLADQHRAMSRLGPDCFTHCDVKCDSYVVERNRRSRQALDLHTGRVSRCIASSCL